MNIKEINNAISSLEGQFADAVNGIVEQTLAENFKDQLRTEKSKKNIVAAAQINDKIESLIKERKTILIKLSPELFNEPELKPIEEQDEDSPELKPENHDSE